MALLDIFKKKPSPEENRRRASKKKEEKREAKPKEFKEEIIKATPDKKKRHSASAYRVLHSPHITEKATILAEKNKYVFKVWPGANKTEIKKEVEAIYGVDVKGVKIINAHKKQRRVRGVIGWTKSYKKAIVELGKGQKIEILPR